MLFATNRLIWSNISDLSVTGGCLIWNRTIIFANIQIRNLLGNRERQICIVLEQVKPSEPVDDATVVSPSVIPADPKGVP